MISDFPTVPCDAPARSIDNGDIRWLDMSDFGNVHRCQLPDNRRPDVEGPLRDHITFVPLSRIEELSRNYRIRHHANVVGEADEGVRLEADPDLLSGGLIGELNHNDPVAGDDAAAEIDVTARPDFNGVHQRSPAALQPIAPPFRSRIGGDA